LESPDRASTNNALARLQGTHQPACSSATISASMSEQLTALRRGAATQQGRQRRFERPKRLQSLTHVGQFVLADAARGRTGLAIDAHGRLPMVLRVRGLPGRAATEAGDCCVCCSYGTQKCPQIQPDRSDYCGGVTAGARLRGNTSVIGQ
jgi:hypothetical protein